MDDAQIEKAISVLRKEVSALPGSGVKGGAFNYDKDSGNNLFTTLFYSNRQRIIEIAIVFVVVCLFLHLSKPSWIYIESTLDGHKEINWIRFLVVSLILSGITIAAYYYIREKVGF